MKSLKNNKDTFKVAKTVVRVEVSGDRLRNHPLPWQWFTIVEGFGLWLRFGYGYGRAPGSNPPGLHRMGGPRHGLTSGWWLRIGSPFQWHCWTGLIHWKRQTDWRKGV